MDYSFTKVNHILSHKIWLNKFQKTKILQSTFSDLSEIKSEVNNSEISRKV